MDMICILMLYICTKFCEIISKSFRVTDPNSKADASVVANVDNQADKRTHGWKTRSLYCAMPEAGVTKKELQGTCQ